MAKTLAGFVKYKGIVLPKVEADEYKRWERKIRYEIDTCYDQSVASYVLKRFERQFTFMSDDHKKVFETIAEESRQRWQNKWGTKWVEEIEGVE